ncbi:protein FAR1-related sequence 5 [Tanacetum coccineum]
MLGCSGKTAMEPDATSFGDFSNREWQIGVIFESTPLFLIPYQQTRCGGSLKTSVGTNTQSRNVPASRGSHILQNKEDIYCLEDYTAQESSISQNSVSFDVVVESSVPSGTVLNALTEEIVAYEKESDETHAVKIKGNVYDSVDGCVVAYMKYAAEAGFVVRRSCQKRLRNGDVKQKYLVCNRKGCHKGIHVDTLDLENIDKQKRNSNLHIIGCKGRVMFNLDPRTRKFVLNVFDTIHNHELEREEFKHLSKRESDAQMLIHKMENRKKHVSDFSFDYLVENAELSVIFWADEVSNLKYLLDQRVTTPTQMKWLPKLIGFDYEVVYKKGSENMAADALSRISASEIVDVYFLSPYDSWANKGGQQMFGRLFKMHDKSTSKGMDKMVILGRTFFKDATDKSLRAKESAIQIVKFHLARVQKG